MFAHELLPALLKDGEHEGVLSLLKSYALAHLIPFKDLANFVGDLEMQGRHGISWTSRQGT